MSATQPRLAVRKTYKLYIGGQFPRSESGRTLVATSPTGATLGHYSRASRKDLRNAIQTARKAQPAWEQRTAFNRAQILYRAAEMLESRRETFVAGLVTACAWDAKQASTEVDEAIDRLVWYAGWADKISALLGTVNPVAAPFFNVSAPEAVGVVVASSSDQSPLVGLCSLLASIVVSGNVAVIVVEGPAPTIAIDLAEVLATSDLPGGVVNLLTGQRDELLPWAADHMEVDALVGIGNGQTQRRDLEQRGAENLKRIHFHDDAPAQAWYGDHGRTLWWIAPLLETKTTWHPARG